MSLKFRVRSMTGSAIIVRVFAKASRRERDDQAPAFLEDRLTHVVQSSVLKVVTGVLIRER